MDERPPGSEHSPGSAAPPSNGPKRLLWGLVFGVVLLNLLIFLATLRERGPSGSPGGATNTHPVLPAR